jgi:hypothetical protein
MAGLTSMLIGGAALGALGGMGQKGETQLNTSGLDKALQGLAGYQPTAQNFKGTWGGQDIQMGALKDVQGLSGGQYAQQAFGAQNDLANLYGQYQQSGGLPNQQDLSASNAFAAQQFAPQQVALQQAFQTQIQQANQHAALSGRSTNDPILRAKLAQEQTRQQAQLQAQQGAFAGQTAMGLSDKRLQFAEGRSNALSSQLQSRIGLAQNIFGLGTQVASQDQARNQLLGSLQSESDKYRLGALSAAMQGESNKSDMMMQQSKANADRGGGFGDIMKGALGGAGMGMGAAGFMKNMGSSTPALGAGMGSTGTSYGDPGMFGSAMNWLGSGFSTGFGVFGDMGKAQYAKTHAGPMPQ